MSGKISNVYLKLLFIVPLLRDFVLMGLLIFLQIFNPWEIPPHGRNDSPLHVGDDAGEGGGGAAAFPCNTQLKSRLSFRTK